jgi:hypothetical protein
LATVTAVATADPTDSSSPPTPSETTQPSETPSETPSESENPPPKDEPAAASLADLDVKAVFDKASYATGEEMSITVTVTNTGTGLIRTGAIIRTEEDSITETSPNPLEGLDIKGGGTFTGKLTGVATSAKFSTAKLYLLFISGNEQRELTFPVAVTPRLGHASGSVYGDSNGNGKFDKGEGLAGATLTWTNKLNSRTESTVTTDSAGAFALDVPTGTYYVNGKAQDAEIGSRTVTVDESGVDGLLFRATPPLYNLAVAAKFAKDTYKPDESPTLHITLANKGDLPLTGIVADCYDRSAGLTGAGDGWGALAGDGVTVAPHSTKVMDVTEAMPADAADHGYVTADCDFAYRGVSSDTNPNITVYASVPGKFADVSGVVTSYVETDLTGFRVVLAAPDGGCPITADAKTDADGNFSLGRVPVGRYTIILVPPNENWWVKLHNFSTYTVIAGQENRTGFLVSPGPRNGDFKTPPNCPGNPGGNAPAPQGSAAPGLAYTGASLVVPGIVGLLALLAGVGAVLVTRRRRTS